MREITNRAQSGRALSYHDACAFESPRGRCQAWFHLQAPAWSDPSENPYTIGSNNVESGTRSIRFTACKYWFRRTQVQSFGPTGIWCNYALVRIARRIESH